MKFKNPLLVVKDMDASVEFYKNVLGLHKIMDLGANVTLTGGVCLQTLDTWKEFIGTEEIIFGARDTELYFEEDDFDKFLEKLESLDLDYVHSVREHSWGQRVLRFYDPDRHVIEVGENMKSVCRKFLDGGMPPEQAAERMGVPLKFVKGCMRKKTGRPLIGCQPYGAGAAKCRAGERICGYPGGAYPSGFRSVCRYPQGI